MMKLIHLALFSLLLPDFVLARTGEFYHSEEGMECTDCHRKFGSGVRGAKPGETGLTKSSVTDLCLSCHSSGRNTAATADLPGLRPAKWTAPIVMTGNGEVPPGIAMPAGDFYWSNRDPRNGHNPAFDKGSATPSRMIRDDQTLGSRPPGGSLAETGWSCVSCHGPHYRFDPGNSAWRQLKRRVNNINVTGDVSRYGVEGTAGEAGQHPGFEPIKSNSRGDIQDGRYVERRKDGEPLEGADLFQPESDHNKNVYRGGFSSFCAACHGNFHEDGGGTGSGSGRADGSWTRHPTNLKLGRSSRYGVEAYSATISNRQGINPNPHGYDWKYPLVKADRDFALRTSEPSDSARTLSRDDRIMCLTCHRAHATQFRNMTRWDSEAHSFIAAGNRDFTGEVSSGDNPAYGCGKCHQMGGVNAFIRGF